eukprot:6942844-Pyramimonas_sp.AAC.1
MSSCMGVKRTSRACRSRWCAAGRGSSGSAGSPRWHRRCALSTRAATSRSLQSTERCWASSGRTRSFAGPSACFSFSTL